MNRNDINRNDIEEKIEFKEQNKKKSEKSFFDFLSHIKNGKQNNFNKFLLAFLLIGYCIFFTSNFYIRVRTNLKITPVNSVLTLENNRDITLKRWEYSPNQNLMEIELDINNKSFDGIDKYLYGIVFRPEKKTSQESIEIDRVVEEPNFVVLHIKNVPSKFNEVSFRMKVDNDNLNEIIKFYSNINDIKKTDNITAKTKVEYLIDRIRVAITEMQAEISNKKSNIADLESKIENIKEKNDYLEADKKYQTQKEQEQTESAIEVNNNQISAFEEEIEEIQSEIEEIQNKIKMAEERISAISKG